MRSNTKRRVCREVGAVPAEGPRSSLYDEATARIVGELEAGRFP